MNDENVELIGPTHALKDEFQATAAEFRASGDDSLRFAVEDFAALLEKMAVFARGENLPPGCVPEHNFWLVRGVRILGRSGLRMSLNAELEKEGGHIGYAIRPSERQKGYGALILRLTLEKAKILKLNRLLLTCDTDNTASAKIIEKNGGVLSERGVSEKTGKLISRYWIEIE